MQKIPDSRGVPPKILGGLYRAGVAELQQHIIRMVMMSTKIWCLFCVMVSVGRSETGQVSQLDIYSMLRIGPSILLLLDLFIYLNFEQKQQAAHHRDSSTSITCTVEISHQSYYS